MSSEIVYTYNSYECELRTNKSWFDSTSVLDNSRKIIRAILSRMCISTSTIGSCICCGYDIANNMLRLCFLFDVVEKKEGLNIVLKFYHAECDLTMESENLKINNCKIYCSKPGYGNNLDLRISIEEKDQDYWVVLFGYTGKIGRIEELPADEYLWKLLYGWYMDRTNTEDPTYVVIPPKSFFVDGEHKDFISSGIYECYKSIEVTNIDNIGPDDDDENSGNSEGD